VTQPPLFDWIAEAIERGSSLSRLEARGALRLTLQKLGLDAKELSQAQAVSLLDGGLAADLEERGVPQASELCRRIRQDLAALAAAPEPQPAVSAGPPPTLFDWVAQAVEAQTTLSRLEARGTLRLALKAAGVAPERASRREIEVVLKAVAPKHLHACSVRDADAVCIRILGALRTAVVVEDAPAGDSPEDVFGRFARR
jgi:hypothetical protein